jgi:3-dehydroquinate synthase
MSLLSRFVAHTLNPDERQTLTVSLGNRSYPIHIGSGLLNEASYLIRETLGQVRCIIITDSHVAPHYAEKLQQNLAQANMCQDEPLVMPAGEQSKTFSYLSFLLDHLFQRTIDRRTVLVALGGGVIGDLTGFAASIALRGIDFVQIPTTLLAQVDSSVGGKTGINSPRGKNMIGSFHQPRLVLADVDTLKTLPTRELRAGYAEIVKYGLIYDKPFFEWLETKGHALLHGKKEKQVHAIKTCCAMKAEIVSKDEKESGLRMVLNLGHTFGHAFEAGAGFSNTLLHGEAVALGLVKAFELSHRLGHCKPAEIERVRHHLNAVGLPTSIKGRGFDSGQLLGHMYSDKKAENGELTFILARSIGEAFVERHVAANDVRAILDVDNG